MVDHVNPKIAHDKVFRTREMGGSPPTSQKFAHFSQPRKIPSPTKFLFHSPQHKAIPRSLSPLH